MLHTTRRGRFARSLVPLTAAAATTVGAAGLAVLAAPAAHATPDPGATFTWGLSSYVTGGSQSFNVFSASNGATVDTTAKTVTFSGGVGRTDTGTHETDVTYEGTVTFGSSFGYSFDVTDPTVVVDDAGHGKITADVDWTVTGVSGGQDDLTLTTFTSNDAAWTGFTLGATPTWEGAVPAGTTYTTSQGDQEALDGASWAQEFVTALPSSVRGFFFKSGTTAANDLKAPAAFTAEVPGPAISVTDSTTTADEVSFDVSGTGFTAVTKPGDAGVYVGLAPRGGLPNVSTQDAMSNFAAAAYVGGSFPGATPITDGAFSTTLNADTSKLVAGTSYSIYTWQAHTHSNTSQDTETPVDIDWAGLGATTVKPAVTAAGVVYGTAGSVQVSVPGVAGSVTLTGLGAPRTATLTNGTATFPVPAGTAAGSYALTASYGGEFLHFPASTTATFNVTKAASTLTASWAKKPKTGKKAKLVVKASGPATVAAPTGLVTVKVVRGAKRVALKGNALRNGQVTVKLTKKQATKLGKGTWKATATYAGAASFTAATSTVKTKVKR